MAASFRQISALLLLFLQLQFPTGMSAQQAPPGAPGVLQLTLKQAVQLALKQNPQRIIAQILVSESDRSSQIARSALLPQAAITGRGAKSQYNLQSENRLPADRQVPTSLSRRDPRSRNRSSAFRFSVGTRSAGKARVKPALTNKPHARM
jgi:outer membrane protein TolC